MTISYMLLRWGRAVLDPYGQERKKNLRPEGLSYSKEGLSYSKECGTRRTAACLPVRRDSQGKADPSAARHDASECARKRKSCRYGPFDSAQGRRDDSCGRRRRALVKGEGGAVEWSDC